MVVAGRLGEALDILRRQLGPVELERQLVELAGKFEWALVILVVHGRTGVGADVESFVPLKDERDGVRHFLGGDLPAVHFEHARAGLADAAHVRVGRCRSCY